MFWHVHPIAFSLISINITKAGRQRARKLWRALIRHSQRASAKRDTRLLYNTPFRIHEKTKKTKLVIEKSWFTGLDPTTPLCFQLFQTNADRCKRCRVTFKLDSDGLLKSDVLSISNLSWVCVRRHPRIDPQIWKTANAVFFSQHVQTRPVLSFSAGTIISVERLHAARFVQFPGAYPNRCPPVGPASTDLSFPHFLVVVPDFFGATFRWPGKWAEMKPVTFSKEHPASPISITAISYLSSRQIFHAKALSLQHQESSIGIGSSTHSAHVPQSEYISSN